MVSAHGGAESKWSLHYHPGTSFTMMGRHCRVCSREWHILVLFASKIFLKFLISISKVKGSIFI
jgi:hypothetical protein